MTVQNLSAQLPFITKDGSAIRSILDRTNAPVQNQSLAEARIPAGGRTERHYHKLTEELYFILEGAGDIEGKVTRVGASERGQRTSFKWWARAMRSSSLPARSTRSRLQSRYAFSVAARLLMRTRTHIWNNR